MLTAELVRLHKDGDALTVKPLAAKARPRALEYAAFLVETAAGLLGEPREEVEAALAAFDLRPAEARLGAGLRRLVLDRCAFASDDRLDAPGLRAEVFLAATAARRGLAEEARFDRGAVLAAVAAARGEAPEAIDGALFGDLKQAQVLNDFAAISPESLLEVYELAQAQAVLLRAYGVEAEVEGGTPADYRHLFRTLKFRRLLYRLAPLPGEGYRVILEGPHALFNASTRYGL
jgi:predicted nuclease of restriction endonuclease-like RecB superfamily